MPNYEVTFTGACVVVVVDAKDEKEAVEMAEDKTYGNFDVDEIHSIELKTPDALDSAKRHANAVSEPEADDVKP